MPVVSKTLRHSTLSTTANAYSHLTPETARGAVDTIARLLNQAERDNHHPTPNTPHHLEVPVQTPRSHTNQDCVKGRSRPHCDHQAKEAAPFGGSGLRPAKTLVGTTGFEPAQSTASSPCIRLLTTTRTTPSHTYSGHR